MPAAGALPQRAGACSDAEAVRAEVRRVIDALAPGGGYTLSPGHPCFQVDVPVANIVAMYEEGFAYGRY